MTRLSLEQMMSQINHDQASAELLEQLLATDTAYTQPQNLTDEAWEKLDSALPATDWSDAEVQSGCDRFFNAMSQCWPKASKSELVNELQAQFGTVLPSAWLQTICDRAENLAQATVSPLEQLVDCVQPLLTDWSLDDLQVFARPMAFAMRSTPTQLPTPQSWSELSPVEQARYTIQVAQYALKVAQSNQTGS